MKKIILSLAAIAASASLASAAVESSPLWLRNTAVSPDGSKVAFTYKGDIYTIPYSGGTATRITSDPAYDTAPIWSPDGKSIAFASDREGSLDIYIVDAEGGTPRRLTTNSGSETPRAFLDPSTIIFSSSVMPDNAYSQGAFLGQTYTVDVNGGRPRIFLSIPMNSVSVAPDGRILYQDRKGLEDELRKHEHSSGTADIWLINPSSSDMRKSSFRKLTSFDGQDQNPRWDGSSADSFYYLSEEDGTSNVYRSSLDGSGKTRLTSFKGNPVRHLSASADGRRLAFSQDGEIYTLTPGSDPVKMPVTINADLYQPASTKTVRTRGASSVSVRPDGEEIAFILNGDVYVTSTKYNTTKRITDTDAQERVVTFSPDGKSLVYDSERDGIWQLFIARRANNNEDSFTYATEIVEEPLYRADGRTAFQPAFSPDGKKVAFLEDRTELRVIDMDSRKVNTALDGKYNYSYTDGDITFTWSPDSRWLLADYIGIGGWNNKDIALVAADGSKVVDLTNSGYSDGNPHWALDGKAMTWESDRAGYRSHGSWGAESDVYIMFFDADAFDRFNMSEEEVALLDKKKDSDKKEETDKADKKDKKGKKGSDKAADKKDKSVQPLEFDLENAKYRVKRLTRSSSRLGDHYVDKKGENLYYIASYDQGGDLWAVDLKKGDMKSLHKGIGFGSISTDKKADKLYIAGNNLSTVAIPGGKRDNINFSADVTLRPAERRDYIYGHVWQQVKDKFYDENLHGVDWDGYRTQYERFLPYINNNYDMAVMLSELLGELNASHTGSRYYPAGANYPVAVLGAFYDESYDGQGLKIKEVVKGGPLADKRADVEAGDIILAIDGNTIEPGADYFPLLEGKTGKVTHLTVKKSSGKVADVTVKPISSGAQSNLLYRRWVERNRAIVDSVSGGRVGYVHVSGMNSPSYRQIYDEMLGLHRNADAIIVDTRYNGGGWLHNDLAVLMNGKEYTRFTPRGRYIGSEPFSQWYKPSVMLVNEANYSDGYGAPYAYQTLKLGDIVGAPIPGTMTAVWWEYQIDPTIMFGIPQVTNADINGKALENVQLNPDVLIYNTPEEILNGGDSQLVGATRHLLERLAKESK
ncbi:MAG: PDZ domain-containing protein [Muribaculaceae bacterium]|nr:PDZ domain-containing protein [Muribaculaceae bacterium]